MYILSVLALRGDGCENLLGALRKAAGVADLSAEVRQMLLSHFKHQQQHQQQQKQLSPGAYNLAFLAAYSSGAASAPRRLLLFTVDELEQQQQQPGANMMRRPTAAPPIRVSTISSKKRPYPSFPSLEDPYKWTIVELREQGKLQRLLHNGEVLHASPDFTSENSISEFSAVSAPTIRRPSVAPPAVEAGAAGVMGGLFRAMISAPMCTCNGCSIRRSCGAAA